MMVDTRKHRQRKDTSSRCGGFTLIEVMVSIFIVMILATGAMGYQYHSTRDVKLSEAQATASQIAMLQLESWKGQQGDLAFNPVDVFGDDVAIQTATSGPDVPNNLEGVPLTTLGNYEVMLGGINYYVTLSYEDPSDQEPMLLNATVAWKSDYSQGDLTGAERFVRYSAFLVSY